MTARELLSDGRLTDAIAEQKLRVSANPDDAAAGLFFCELLILDGQLLEARHQLRMIVSSSPEWKSARRKFADLIRAERRRSDHERRPTFLEKPPSPELIRRWRAMQALRDGNADAATRWIDRADAIASPLNGHLDGREFDGLRDADDRFASVLELFIGPHYAWCPFPRICTLRLAPVQHVLDVAYRDAAVRLHDGTKFNAVVPLLYPRSAAAGDDYALGRETDWPDVGGPVIGVGAKVLLVGDDELLLSECNQIEL